MAEQFLRMEVKGIIKDSHANFPIKFDVSDSGTSYLIGAKVHATKKINGGKEIEQRMDIRAFGEVAEALAHLQDGDSVHLSGEYGLQKGKDDKWYSILTIDTIIEA